MPIYRRKYDVITKDFVCKLWLVIYTRKAYIYIYRHKTQNTQTHDDDEDYGIMMLLLLLYLLLFYFVLRYEINGEREEKKT